MNMKLYAFLAYPAHLYLSILAPFFGMTFEHGPADEDGEFLHVIDGGKDKG